MNKQTDFRFPRQEKFKQGVVTGRLGAISFAITPNHGSCTGDLYARRFAIRQSLTLDEPSSPECLARWLQREIEDAEGEPYQDGLKALLAAIRVAYNL